MPISYETLSRSGRLGNQLWEIASTYGIACGQLDDPSFPAWDYQPFFSCPDEWFNGAQGSPATDFVPHMDPRAKAYLQDYNLFRGVEKQVKAFFRPSEAAKDVLGGIWANDLYPLLKQLVDGPLISVHIRRGDNVTHPEGFHPLRSWDYYRSALDLCTPDGEIIVFSDDPDWCEQHFEKETGRTPALFYRGTPRPREYEDRQLYENAPVLDWIDVCLMAACNEHVISNSTYAWWGAFLSEDPSPIFPSNWFGWKIKEWTDASLMFPESWREVEDPTMGGA